MTLTAPAGKISRLRIFSSPITNLLLVLCVFMQIHLHANVGGGGGGGLRIANFMLYWLISSDDTAKYSNERVKHN